MPGVLTPSILSSDSNLVIVAYIQGGRSFGLGHVYRSELVISELEAFDVKVHICFDGDEFGKHQLQNLGKVPISFDDLETIEKIDVLLIDGIYMPEPFTALIKKTQRVILLSPVFDHPEIATEAYLRFVPINSNYTNPFVGRMWSVVGKGSTQTSSISESRLSIGVSLSGGVSSNLTQTLAAIIEIPNLSKLIRVLKVAIGGHSFKEVEEILKPLISMNIDLVVVRANGNIISALSPVDIVICGDGITVDETCHAGIPCVVYADISRKYKVIDLIASNAICFSSNLQELKRLILELLTNEDKRKELGRIAASKVDGKGAHRIAEKILSR